MAQDRIAESLGWGLKLLWDGSHGRDSEGLCLDIVLVHGLGGHQETTWRAEDGSIWARDLLSSSIPNLRVFAYGYASTPRSTCNRTTVHSIAVDLLGLLTDDRDVPRFKYRPLIFAGHNLGGNIIKEALVTEKGRAGGEYRDIYYSTCGVLFFATPHKGLNARMFNRLIMANKHPLARFQRNAPSQLLNEMDEKDHRIGDLLGRFQNVTDFGFVSLLEGVSVPGMSGVIVNRTSGTLGWGNETERMLDTVDHIQMCKFSGTEADSAAMRNELDVLAQRIKDIVITPAKATTFADNKRLALEWLGVLKMQPGKRPVEPAEGTCESIAQECFDEWHSGHEGTQDSAGHGNFSSLWVRGPKGCGKAHLAKHMAEKWEEYRFPGHPKPQHVAIVAHCSVNDLIPRYRTASSVALCWLREVLDTRPRLIRHLTNRYDGREAANNPGFHVCDWEDARIANLWHEVIVAVAKEVDFLVFIADGMDKCDGARALPTLIGWVDEAAKKVATSQDGRAQFQILVFSNDSEKLRHLNQFPVHELTAKSFRADVECAVKYSMAAILRRYAQDGEPDGTGKRGLKDLLRETFLDGEEKTHLWAAVLVGEIEVANFLDKASLISFLDDLNGRPDGGKLYALYGTIVRRILSTDGLGTHSLNALFWMVHHIGTMNVEELLAGCVMLEAAGYGEGGHGDGLPGRRIQEEDVNATRLDYRTLVLAVKNCGGLVKVWPRGLCLIHGSFRDYLTTSPDLFIHQNYRCSQITADKVISRLCMDYLLLRRFGNAGPSMTTQGRYEWEDKVNSRVKENKFVRYASLRWTEHLQRSGFPFDPRHTSHKKRSRLRRLLDPEQEYMRSWTEVLWFWTKSGEGLSYPTGPFPWQLFWGGSKHRSQPGETSPSLGLPPPSTGSPDFGQSDSGRSSPQRPVAGSPISGSPNEGEEKWWRKKRVWFIILALVIIIIGSTVGGVVGSQPSNQENGTQQTGTGP